MEKEEQRLRPIPAANLNPLLEPTQAHFLDAVDAVRRLDADAIRDPMLRGDSPEHTSKQLALALAELAKKIRARVRAGLDYEDGFGQIRKLEAAFRAALVHDLSDDDFADMYAQTITYGHFSAAVSRPAGIHGDNIVDMVSVTNPFLRDMLKTFLHLSRPQRPDRLRRARHPGSHLPPQQPEHPPRRRPSRFR
ncbi:MAG: hypothetical protein ABI233_00540 [Chthoniobacterales bacterium]